MFSRSCSGVDEYAFSGVEQLEAALHPEPGIWGALSTTVEFGVIAAVVIYASFYMANRLPGLRATSS